MALHLVRDAVPSHAPAPSGPRRNTPERRFVETPDGHRLAYVVAGEGPDLVLLHGALMALEDMWIGPLAALELA